MSGPAGPLAGRRVATTRDRPGQLDELLAGLGATVVHVPLIEIVDAPGEALAAALARLDEVDWVVVTSHHGAVRVAAAVARRPRLLTAAVGTHTAQVLAAGTGREVTVVPARQTAVELVAAMPAPSEGARRVLVAQADRAEPTLVDRLRARGFAVQAVVAYETRLRRPTAAERASLAGVDAVAFASGSAARAWAAAIGTQTPPHVVAIGPTTARAARDVGLQVTAVAADHSVAGLAAAVANTLPPRS
jgi:uroporphyrinogen-III synthase